MQNDLKLVNINDERFWDILFDEACVEGQQATRIRNELEKIIAYDVEKVVGQLGIKFEDYLDEIIDRKEKANTLDFLKKQHREICKIVRNGGKE